LERRDEGKEEKPSRCPVLAGLFEKHTSPWHCKQWRGKDKPMKSWWMIHRCTWHTEDEGKNKENLQESDGLSKNKKNVPIEQP